MRTWLTFAGMLSVLTLATLAGRTQAEPSIDQFPSIVRLGPEAASLSADDLRQIQRLGGEPWIVVARQAAALTTALGAESRAASIFIQPDRFDEELTTGLVLHAQGISRKGSKTREWVVRSMGRWSQVAGPGRGPAEVVGPRDINRPFYVGGSINDDRLREAIALIRSSPRIAPPPSTRRRAPVHAIFTNVRGDWPVQSVKARDASTITVYLLDERPDERSGQRVELALVEGRWTVRKLFAFNID